MVILDSDSEGSSDSGEPCERRHLRFVDVLTEVPNGDAANATELLLNDRGLTSLDSLEQCPNMKKLELRGNFLAKTLSFLEMNHRLCWLNLAKNRLKRISHLNNLSSLAVLDISDNRIARLDGLAGLKELKALIAVRNRITRIEGLSPATNPKLETLVFSDNKITECTIKNFPFLRKLSLSHNQLKVFPRLENLQQLSELRLNSNKLVTVDKCVALLPRVSILDIGNNLVTATTALEPLKSLRLLHSLNLKGNKVADDMDAEAVRSLLASMTKLEIINHKRESTPKAKKKRKPGTPHSAVKRARDAAIRGRSFEGRGNGRGRGTPGRGVNVYGRGINCSRGGEGDNNKDRSASGMGDLACGRSFGRGGDSDDRGDKGKDDSNVQHLQSVPKHPGKTSIEGVDRRKKKMTKNTRDSVAQSNQTSRNGHSGKERRKTVKKLKRVESPAAGNAPTRDTNSRKKKVACASLDDVEGSGDRGVKKRRKVRLTATN
eukprot:TRINITY_DN77847_c0_g1_i1.p1 TRINITY_DN77847_c0_g1~~TRINITY_DN77847_c0_g1_i1.p1  ORF type:complete len:490 (-),score=69.29 TRINITY_DN77847_c0_g1_i1:45-1514(-)